MGIYDREYYGDEEPRGFQVGSPTALVTQLVIVNVAVFLANWFLFSQNNWLNNTLELTPEVFRKPWLLWKVLTYGFAHSPDRLGHIAFNMLGLWIFGRELEQKYGKREFLAFYLLAIILGGVVWALVKTITMPENPNIALIGASGGVTAVIILFCFNYPKRTLLLMMVFPVPAWVVGLMVVVINAFSLGSSHVAYDVHLVGAAFAFVYFQLGWRLTRFLPAGSPGGGRTRRRRGPKLKVFDGAAEREEQLDREADRVLAKISSEGEESLTKKERKILEAYSRRMREKRR